MVQECEWLTPLTSGVTEFNGKGKSSRNRGQSGSQGSMVRALSFIKYTKHVC